MADHDRSRRQQGEAHGRYSGSDQGDDRRHDERRGHGVYGYGAEEGPGYDREDRRAGGHYGAPGTVDRDDDLASPDRSRPSDRFNSGYGRHQYDRAGQPSSGYRGRVERGYRGAGGYSARLHDRGHADEGSAYAAQTDRGPHRGRGPKGYRRADSRIQEEICDILTDDPHLDATNIEIAVKEGEVTLSGTVETRAARRHAEELIEDLSGVGHVQNNLRVAQTQN